MIEQSLEGVYGNLQDTVSVELAGAVFNVRQCDQNSVEWAKAIRQFSAPYKAKIRRDKELPAELDRQIARMAFVECCLVGWSGLRATKDGPEIPFTPDEANRIFAKYTRLFSDLMAEASDIDRFRKTALEDTAGN